MQPCDQTMPDSAAMSATLFARQRRAMIDSQLRPNKMTDERILEAMAWLPREEFVPEAAAQAACRDEDIAVAPGRFLLEPLVLARLAQAAEIRVGDKVLEIGCNTGYGAALLSCLGAIVYAMDEDSSLVAAAAASLRRLDLTATCAVRPLASGWSEAAPFDAILVHGAVASVPEAWTGQLAEGGRLLVVAAEGNRAARTGRARLYRRLHGAVSHRDLFDANAAFLPGFAPKEDFIFGQ